MTKTTFLLCLFNFFFQAPTLSKKQQQIRMQGWRKALEGFDSYTLVIQNGRSAGLDQSFIQLVDQLCDGHHCQA